MAGQTFYKDKPYVFVPFTVKEPEDTNKGRPKVTNKGYSHQECLQECGGRLEITIKAITPLHFGQGDLLKEKDVLVHALTRENGRAAYPGTSFKGMIRSVFEAVSNSCILIRPSQKEFQNAFPQKSCKCTNSKDACPACSVFGMFGKKGKLTFTSFRAEEKIQTQHLVIPELQSPFRNYPNDKCGNERLYYGDFKDIHRIEIANMDKEEFFKKKNQQKKEDYMEPKFYGRKFYKHAEGIVPGNDKEGCTYECLRPGTELRGYINYEGLTEHELSILAFSLGLGWDTPIYHKMGYAKPAYFGSVSLQIRTIEPEPRYKTIYKYHDLASLQDLAGRYYKNADGCVKEAVKAIEEIWTSTDGKSQWKKVNNHLTY